MSASFPPRVNGQAAQAGTVAFFGDSFTANNGSMGTYASPVASNSVTRADGYSTWALMRLRGRLEAVKNAGVGGQTTAQILARVTDVTALNPKPGFGVVQGGSNDVASGTNISAATIIANQSAICNALLAAGITPVLTTCPPNTTFLTKQGIINRGLKDYARATPGVLFCDWFPYIADPSTGDWAAGMSDDGVHPNAKGASGMGQALADVLLAASPPSEQLAGSNADTQNLISNGLFVGTAGSLGASAGQLATGWTSRMGANATLSKVARTDGLQAPWQQIAMTSPGYAYGDIYQTFNATSGHKYISEVEFETDSGTFNTVGDFALQLAYGDGSNFATANRNAGQTGLGVTSGILWPSSGILRTAPTTAGQTTGCYCFLKFGAVAGTVRFGRARVIEVP